MFPMAWAVSFFQAKERFTKNKLLGMSWDVAGEVTSPFSNRPPLSVGRTKITCLAKGNMKP